MREFLWEVEHIIRGETWFVPSPQWAYNWVYGLNDLDDPWPMSLRIMMGIAGLVAFGIALGKLQSAVLRQRGYGGSRWVLASAMGAIVGNLGVRIYVLSRIWAFVGYLGYSSRADDVFDGIGFGAIQWLVIRHWFHRAGWWVVAVAVGEALSPQLVSVKLSGVVNGIVTGLVLCWLLRQPIAGQVESQQTAS